MPATTPSALPHPRLGCCLQTVCKMKNQAADALAGFIQGAQQLKELRQARPESGVGWCINCMGAQCGVVCSASASRGHSSSRSCATQANRGAQLGSTRVPGTYAPPVRSAGSQAHALEQRLSPALFASRRFLVCAPAGPHARPDGHLCKVHTGSGGGGELGGRQSILHSPGMLLAAHCQPCAGHAGEAGSPSLTALLGSAYAAAVSVCC